MDDALSRLTVVEKETNTKELFACHIVNTHHLFVRRQNIPDECLLDMETIIYIHHHETCSFIAKLKESMGDTKSA